MLDAQFTRRPWTDDCKRQLIEYWDSVRSIVLISIMLDRTPSSIQTQASRLGLPRRTEESDRHRRRWTRRDEEDLDTIVSKLTLPSGKIPIEEVARQAGRSIDAVASRLLAKVDKPATLLDRILLPTPPKTGCKSGRSARTLPGAVSMPRKAPRSRKAGQTRACLSCRKPFWSEGAHNRICSSCKREQSGGWDW